MEAKILVVILSPSISGAMKDPTSRYEMKRKDAKLWAEKYQQNAVFENNEHELIFSKIKRFFAKIFGK
ncbi:hypothetical protein [Thermococcus sp.]